MKTEAQVRSMIKEIETSFKQQLTGRVATIQVNAPLALIQVGEEAKLRALYWVIGEQYVSKLK
jgi:uncharacterized protein (DUF736 family)